MENMDKGLSVPKWVLIPQMPQNLSVDLSAQAQKLWISIKKRLHWASVVRATERFVSVFRETTKVERG